MLYFLRNLTKSLLLAVKGDLLSHSLVVFQPSALMVKASEECSLDFADEP
jgi:hypothetical protein